MSKQSKTIYLKDYQASNFLIKNCFLCFHLDPDHTVVQSKLELQKNPNSKAGNDLFLNGEQLKLHHIKIDGKTLKTTDYELDELGLRLKNCPDEFVLELENSINPAANTSLNGIYLGEGIFCSQNEPEGFRRITYFLDRPDNMSIFTVKIIADKKAFPILLSNGNLIEKGDLAAGKHFVLWQDPFKKPSYLFALVAGDLAKLEDIYQSPTGKKVKLEFFAKAKDIDKCHFALQALKDAMLWDEQVYQRVYDLDLYMIVAVDIFNSGAMENKGLNIFNTIYVLADAKTATDIDYYNVQSVIAHEYFHNWTGNRITCQSWFELTLKEGLTVFRDQEFSSDLNSRVIKRLDDASTIKQRQFAEDAGPTAHPIKPKSYISMKNFYTRTVYEKGSEVIRMLYTLLGKEQFLAAMQDYFDQYDGQAITTNDFVAVFERKAGLDLSQFKLWYDYAGTTEISVKSSFQEGVLKLQISQHCPDTPGQNNKKAMFFPLQISLIDDTNGKNLLNKTLTISQKSEDFSFEGFAKKPLVAVNVNFSAPIKVKMQQSVQDQIKLAQFSQDLYLRYECLQALASDAILGEINSKHYKTAFNFILASDTAFDAKARLLQLPSEEILKQLKTPIDFSHNAKALQQLKQDLTQSFGQDLLKIYHEIKLKTYSYDSVSASKRSLKNQLLQLLSCDQNHIKLAFEHYMQADNITDKVAGLQALKDHDHQLKTQAFEHFYQDYKDEKLVLMKYFSLLAGSAKTDLNSLKILIQSPTYDENIPNLIFALMGSFARNYNNFHHAASYDFYADYVLKIDAKNPECAARISESFRDCNKLLKQQKQAMRSSLGNIVQNKHLSSNTYEIINKILEQDKSN